jgi:hypothetical protein
MRLGRFRDFDERAQEWVESLPWIVHRPLGVVLIATVTASVTVFLTLAVIGPSRTEVRPVAGRTDIRLIAPVAETGLSSQVRIRKVLPEGECMPFSVADPENADGIRCGGSDSTIYDPCFYLLHRVRVVCLRAPWSNDAVMIRSVHVHGPPGSMSPRIANRSRQFNHVPWGLELASGRRCQFIAGATWLLGGRRANYLCEGGGWVIGVPDRSSPLWRVAFSGTRNPEAVQVEVVRAWS